jgi:hypothetical protein
MSTACRQVVRAVQFKIVRAAFTRNATASDGPLRHLTSIPAQSALRAPPWLRGAGSSHRQTGGGTRQLAWTCHHAASIRAGGVAGRRADQQIARAPKGATKKPQAASGRAARQPTQRRILQRPAGLRLEEVAGRLAAVLADAATVQAGVQPEGRAEVGGIRFAANGSVTAEETQRWNESHGKPRWGARRQTRRLRAASVRDSCDNGTPQLSVNIASAVITTRSGWVERPIAIGSVADSHHSARVPSACRAPWASAWPI